MIKIGIKMETKPKVEDLLSPEQIKELHKEAERQLIKRIEAEVEAEKNDDDFWRPVFYGVKTGQTNQEIVDEIWAFKNSTLYEFLEKELSEEDLHEYIYGLTPWHEYLAKKNKK